MISRKLFKQVAAALIILSFLTDCFSPLKVLAAETVVSDEDQLFETEIEETESAEEQDYFYSPAEDPLYRQ